MEIHNFELNALSGESINFSKYNGKILVIVNVASKCGFTPQYKDLEELNKKYRDQGVEVLGFPCNQFGKQEPGDHQEIQEFCELNYGVSFQMFEKIDVNGANASQERSKPLDYCSAAVYQKFSEIPLNRL